MTLSLIKVAQVKCLGAEGLSNGQVALRARISRDTVRRILTNKYKIQQQPEELLGPNPTGSYVWCYGCGHNVKMPCLACYLRSKRKPSE